ncbi:class I SAM-dependent methyltransferase [Yoonia maritima]|uniref:class I SAM-dependent methyltransferase n=1 Tax=Yoonia maritima TaxID=1435347 RepID=UPI000D0F1084|nr:class I SAM-dependent methyltransferase [Yoonia maritima]
MTSLSLNARSYWDNRAQVFEKQFELAPVRRKVIQRIIEIAKPKSDEIFVDIGMGTARLFTEGAQHFKAARDLVGVDISPEMAEIAKSRMKDHGFSNFEAHVGQFTSLPIETGSVDCVLSSMVMHHMDNSEKQLAIAEVKRILHPQGRIVVADQLDCFQQEVSEDEFREAMYQTFSLDPTTQTRSSKNFGHREHTIKIGEFCNLWTSAGFSVHQEVLDDVIGIVYSQ